MLLDTNVVSDLIRKSPAPAVAAWVSDHRPADLVLDGLPQPVQTMRRGKRRDSRSGAESSAPYG